MPRPTFRERLAGWIAPATRSAIAPMLSPPSAGYAATTASAQINDRSALSIAAVWSAVSVYVNTLGSLDLYIAERTDRGGRRPAPEHPAHDLLRSRPNPRSTSMRLRQAWVGHACTRGNGYVEIEWGGRLGRDLVGLHLLDPKGVKPALDGERLVYHLAGADAARGPIPAENVLHLAMWGFDGIAGYSPIEFHRQTLGLAASQRDYQANVYDNNASAQGHLEVPGNLKANEATGLRTNWNRIHQGPSNAGNIGILEGGIKFVQSSFSPADAEIIAGSKLSVEDVARIWNLPQHKLNLLENANFSTVEQMNLDFYQSSILPWLTAIEQEIDLKLLTRLERATYFAFHDVRSLLRGDLAAQTAQDTADLSSGVRSLNEVRIDRGLNPIDDPRADYHWIPANNLQALELMSSAPAPAGSPAPPASAPAPEPEPEPEPEPAPAPRSASPELLAALRGAAADPLGRMIRREAEAARRAARKPEALLEWLGAFYPAHAEAVAAAIAPTLRAINAATGFGYIPEVVAANIASRSREELRGLVVSVPPDELPAAVDRLVARWEPARAADLVAELIPPTPSPRPEAS